MEQMIQTMLQSKVWAVVGATNNREKFGYKIFKTMREAGLEVYPVNPGVTEILDAVCYPSLEDLPVKPDAVNLVVPPKIGEQVVRQCAALGIRNVWLQPGADAANVVAAAEETGLTVVHHACIMVELRKKEA